VAAAVVVASGKLLIYREGVRAARYDKTSAFFLFLFAYLFVLS